jgi:hypothetical protein
MATKFVLQVMAREGPKGLPFAADTITHPYKMLLALLALVAKVQPGLLRPSHVRQCSKDSVVCV